VLYIAPSFPPPPKNSPSGRFFGLEFPFLSSLISSVVVVCLHSHPVLFPTLIQLPFFPDRHLLDSPTPILGECHLLVPSVVFR